MSDEQKPVIPESGGVRSQLSRKQVLEIQELADKATPGPWRLDTTLRRSIRDKFAFLEIAAVKKAIWIAKVLTFTDDPGEYRANADFIVTARTDVPALACQLDEAMESCEYIYQGHLDHVSPCSCVHCKRYRAYYGDEGGSTK